MAVSSFQHQSWLGRALQEAKGAAPAAPIVARPAPPPVAPPRDRALDRGLMPAGEGGVEKLRRDLAARNAVGGDSGPARRVRRVLAVPELLHSLIMKSPYSAGRRAEEEGVDAAMDTHNFAGNLTRNLTLEGPEDAVDKVMENTELMLRDLQQRHGLVAAPSEPQHGPDLPNEVEQTSYVRVVVEGEEEVITVDKDMGPVWWKAWNIQGFGPSGNGRYFGKEWLYMSSTEREVCLLSAARRIRNMKLQHAG